ncbi:hypothetical protein AB4Z40_27285 [Bosea sp. 2YAB26]|uniref:hypothetical protein n=1 Tax=Bosea sp. 2YAB26 TaxID=3237478 RepID=UPI003F922ABA
MFNLFPRKPKISKAGMVAARLEDFLDMITTAASISAKLGGSADRMVENKLAFHAAIWAAADAYGQLHGASTEETTEGVRLYLNRYGDAEETLKTMLMTFTLPEFAPLVQVTGQAIFAIRAEASDSGHVLRRLTELADFIADFKARPHRAN